MEAALRVSSSALMTHMCFDVTTVANDSHAHVLVFAETIPMGIVSLSATRRLITAGRALRLHPMARPWLKQMGCELRTDRIRIAAGSVRDGSTVCLFTFRGGRIVQPV